MDFNRVLFVAADAGPSQTLKAFVNYVEADHYFFGNSLLRSNFHQILFLIANRTFDYLICGTSKSSEGFNFENKIRIAASEAGIYIICIEDFCGNYTAVDGSNTKILIVESDFSINIYKDKFPLPFYILVCPAIRYDFLRGSQFSFKKIEKTRKSLSVLWAGQPEFEVNFSTLKTLIPALNELSVTLLFKAHQNDMEYTKGRYENYFSEVGLSWLDVSSAKIDSYLFEQVDLVITQFSSVAIEASFYGIPSLNILFEDAGRRLLMERTGSETTSTINYGASFVITEKQSILEQLKTCLTDLKARKKVLANFDRIYETRQVQLPKLLLEIRDIIVATKK